MIPLMSWEQTKRNGANRHLTMSGSRFQGPLWPWTSAQMTPGSLRVIRPETFLFRLTYHSWGMVDPIVADPIAQDNNKRNRIQIDAYIYIYMLVSQSIVHLFPFWESVYSPPFFLQNFRHIIQNNFLPVFGQKIPSYQPKRGSVYSPPLGQPIVHQKCPFIAKKCGL